MAKLTLTRIGGGYGSVTTLNANYALMEAALENTLSRDGGTPNTLSGNIDMNSAGRLVNLLDAVNNQEPVTLAQAALIAGVTSPLTATTIGGALWPQHAIETANGVTAVNLEFYYGDVQRYDAKLDGATDDTTAFNNAIASGWGGYCDRGTAAISGTIVIKTEQTLTCTNYVTLQRFAGASTTPMIHQYGNLSRFFGGGCTIRQNLYDHPDGIVLFGQDPAEPTPNAGTDVQCYNMQFWDAKIIGPEGSGPNAPILTGSPGFYVHSLKRKTGYTNPTYKCTIGRIQILNCDVLMEFSSDANSNYVNGFYGHQWTQNAVYFNGAYGNVLHGILFESPLAGTTDKRYAVMYGPINGGVETGTDAGYAISAARLNQLIGYAELTNGGTTNIAFFNHDETGAVFGLNDMQITGSLSGGIGRDGLSDDAAMGTNKFEGGGVLKVGPRGEKFHWGGFQIRPLDDSSGSYYSFGNSAYIAGRHVAIAEITQADSFSLDGLGPNTVSALIKLTYAAKADAATRAQVGEVHFAVWQEDTGVRAFRKIFESNTSFDEAQIVTPNCVVAEGLATATETIATIGFLTGAPTGVNLFHISWKAEIITSEEEGTNQDFDDNIKLL